MAVLIEILFTGLALGSIYGVIALGFVLVFKATSVFNFAQGAFMMVGAYLAYTATAVLGLPAWVAVPLVLGVNAVIGAALQLVVIRHFLGRSLLTLVMITIAITLVVGPLVGILYGPNPLPLSIGLPRESWLLAGVRISSIQLIQMAVSVVVLGAFGLYFNRSDMGLKMRATAESQEAGLICGIDANRVFAVAWAIGLAMAGVGGLLLTTSLPVSGQLEAVGQLAFPAVVIGGIRSTTGAVIGGLVVGVIEQLGANYIGTDSRFVVVYVVLLAILMVRPHGLFGQPEVERV